MDVSLESEKKRNEERDVGWCIGRRVVVVEHLCGSSSARLALRLEKPSIPSFFFPGVPFVHWVGMGHLGIRHGENESRRTNIGMAGRSSFPRPPMLVSLPFRPLQTVYVHAKK